MLLLLPILTNSDPLFLYGTESMIFKVKRQACTVKFGTVKRGTELFHFERFSFFSDFKRNFDTLHFLLFPKKGTHRL